MTGAVWVCVEELLRARALPRLEVCSEEKTLYGRLSGALLLWIGASTGSGLSGAFGGGGVPDMR